MAILATWYLSVLAILMILACVLLVLVVLIQRGRGGGLAGAFGGIGGHSVLGARTGDFLTWVTIAFAALFILLSIGLNLLTPEEPEPTEEPEKEADSMLAAVTLSADPVSLEQGKDVKLELTATAEDQGAIERVLFYRDANQDGTGDAPEDVLLGNDKYSLDGWSLTVATRQWPVGTTLVVARIVRFDGSMSDWCETTLTITKPAAPPPLATQPSPTATTAPASRPEPTPATPTTPTQPAGEGTTRPGG